VHEEGPELLAEPQRPVRDLAERLDVEIAAGEQTVRGARGDDRESELAIRVAQGDLPDDLDGAGALLGRAEVRPDLIDAQEERARVLLGAEAVVGHRPVDAFAPGLDQGGEAADGLPRTGCRHGVGVDEAGKRRGGRRLGGQQRAALERRELRLGLGGGRRGGDGERQRGQSDHAGTVQHGKPPEGWKDSQQPHQRGGPVL